MSPFTIDNMEIIFFAGLLAVLMLANIVVIVTVFRINRNCDDNNKSRLVCTGCEIIAGVCNVNVWLILFVFFLMYDSHSPNDERWAHCRGFNTVLQIVGCIYNICLCQALFCKPLQYFRCDKERFSSTIFRNAMFVLMPVVIVVYWLISILLNRIHGTQIYQSQAVILDLPGFETVVLDLGNTTPRTPNSVVTVDCLPGNDCVVVPDSLTLCPERVYRMTDLVFDYLVLVLPISLPILWAWTMEEKWPCCLDEESCQLDQHEAAETSSSQAAAKHELRCPYKKVETFVKFLLKMNFQWQFLLRPLLLIICILKGRVYILDVGNKLIVTWIVALVPLVTISMRYCTKMGKERGGHGDEKNGTFSNEVALPCGGKKEMEDIGMMGGIYLWGEVDFRMVDEARKNNHDLDSIHQFPRV